MTGLQRNPDFDVADFLANYWQKKPLVIRDFFSNFSDPLSAEELAGLALEDGIESRLVKVNTDQDYSLRHGPFTEADFLELPESHWTLLVQAVDQVMPEVATIRLAFDFLPSWRVDDVMISAAVPGGGVGPHLDQYDVFLLQGAGSRLWKLSGPGKKDALEITEGGLKLLKEFETDQELTLNCGDVLYIPPGYGHWGTALEPGLCYSIGFRAPSYAEMIEAMSDLAIDQQDDFQRYQDIPIDTPVTPGEISGAGLQRAWESLQPALQRFDLFQQGFGQLVTQPRYPELTQPPTEPVSLESLAAARDAAEQLLRNPTSRFAWTHSAATDGDGIQLFADGEAHDQPRANLQAIISLCDLTIENIWDISSYQQQKEWLDLLLELINRGCLYLPD